MPTLPEELTRLADFQQRAVAAEPYLGISKGDFLKAFRANREITSREITDTSPIVTPLMRYMAKQQATGELSIEIGANELLAALTEIVGGKAEARKIIDWPGAGHVLAGQLERLAFSLRKLGYHAVKHIRTGNKKVWCIVRRANAELPPPEPAVLTPSSVKNLGKPKVKGA